jgi:hypothetical protein
MACATQDVRTCHCEERAPFASDEAIPNWVMGGRFAALAATVLLSLVAPALGAKQSPGAEVEIAYSSPDQSITPHLPYQNICAIIPTAARAAPACTFPIE